MTTIIDSPPRQSRNRRSGRIIERTTTITREVYVDYPDLPASPRESACDSADRATKPLSGVNRLAVRLGIAMADWGRRNAAAHRHVDGAEIARRLQVRKDDDSRFLLGLPR